MTERTKAPRRRRRSPDVITGPTKPEAPAPAEGPDPRYTPDMALHMGLVGRLTEVALWRNLCPEWNRDEIHQEILIQCWNLLRQSYDPAKGKVSTYLMAWGLRHLVRSYMSQRGYKRKHRRRSSEFEYIRPMRRLGVSEILIGKRDPALLALEEEEAADRIRAAIDTLPARDRTAVLMRAEDCTLNEIGQRIGLTRERVRQILLAAQRRIVEQCEVGV